MPPRTAKDSESNICCIAECSFTLLIALIIILLVVYKEISSIVTIALICGGVLVVLCLYCCMCGSFSGKSSDYVPIAESRSLLPA